MTGKRPRALTRTASVSQLGNSGNFLSQEFSPLPENPKEKLKPTVIKEPSPTTPACSARRVVIGFDCASASSPSPSPHSAPCSPSFHDTTNNINNNKASSPRSVLNSLFSRQQRGVVKPSDGVGLGIALHAPTDRDAVVDDIAVVPVRDHHHNTSPPRPRDIPVVQQQHQRRHSHPIPTPGVSPCRLHHHAPPNTITITTIPSTVDRISPRRASPPTKVDRRDTFLLGASPARPGCVLGGDVAAALTASSHFLDECSFCKRHLPEDKDIFMYRGDKAFCSVECRSQQMILDERSKKCASSALHMHGASVATPSRQRAPSSSVAAA